MGIKCVVSHSPSLFAMEYSNACSLSIFSTCSSSLRVSVANVTVPDLTFPSNSFSQTGSTRHSFPPLPPPAGSPKSFARFDGGSSASALCVNIAAMARAQSGMYRDKTCFWKRKVVNVLYGQTGLGFGKGPRPYLFPRASLLRRLRADDLPFQLRGAGSYRAVHRLSDLNVVVPDVLLRGSFEGNFCAHYADKNTNLVVVLVDFVRTPVQPLYAPRHDVASGFKQQRNTVSEPKNVVTSLDVFASQGNARLNDEGMPAARQRAAHKARDPIRRLIR